MLIKCLCGHEIDIPSCNARHTEKTLCCECLELYEKLMKKQKEQFVMRQRGK